MEKLTDEIILSQLQNTASNETIITIMCSITALIVISCCIFSLIYTKKTSSKENIKKNVYCTIGTITFFAILISILINIHNQYNYVINNKNWVIETDTVLKHSTKYNENNNKNYYLHLQNNGKRSVSFEIYKNVSDNEQVYVVLIKNKKDKTFGCLVYSTNKYIYP